MLRRRIRLSDRTLFSRFFSSIHPSHPFTLFSGTTALFSCSVSSSTCRADRCPTAKGEISNELIRYIILTTLQEYAKSYRGCFGPPQLLSFLGNDQ